MSQPISEATAIRLYNSVVASTTSSGGAMLPLTLPIRASTLQFPPLTMTPLKPSIAVRPSPSGTGTAAESESCRICRWDRSDIQIMHCPCRCKGSVGFVHLQCLRRWILHRRDTHCEICHSPFDLPEEKLNLRRRIKTFFCGRCCGCIAKHLLFSASLIPLAHIVLQQVLVCMEKINQSPNEQLTVKEVLMASCALLTSSALFFHFFEFITTRLLIIRNVLRQWWLFGNTNDFEVIELGSWDSQEIF